MDLGVALFAGEAEARLKELLRTADRGELHPLHNFMNDLPSLQASRHRTSRWTSCAEPWACARASMLDAAARSCAVSGR